MPSLLNTASVMICPHGGTVQPVSGDTRVSVGGANALRPSDTFSIIGCTFPPSGPPHPCVQVNWVVSAQRSKALGDFTLTESSVGLCVAADQAVQGTVLILGTQPRVSGV
jgi:hypothetical protein